MNLNSAIKNCKYQILKISYEEKIILSRLIDLGVKEGSLITVVRPLERNSCLVALVDGRLIAISSEICKSITVKKVDSVDD